jgi:BirA family transcriptional regulator, biotin operon repressor / biotin---[acetyl-CoA-carboxylase] ligase
LYKTPANTLFTGQKLVYVPECHSTNSLLAEMLQETELPDGSVLITDYQTQGRGQRGNRWESGRGVNLTFSLLLRPKFLATRDQFQLSMAIALGIASGLQHWVDNSVALKWPNDLMTDDRKLGGVLIENQSQGTQLTASIVGIGINVNQRVLPFPNTCSLIQVVGSPVELNDVFERIAAGVEAKYMQLRSGAHDLLREEYLSLLYRRGVPQLFEAGGRSFTGVITGVDDAGRLLVREGEVERAYSMKEIRMLTGEQT